MRTVSLAWSALISALALGAATTANAIPILGLTTSSGESATVIDGGSGDTSYQAGVVTFLSPHDGAWFVDVTTGLAKPALGSPSKSAFGKATEFTYIRGSGPAYAGTTMKIPEPGTLLLLGAGMLVFVTVARRRREAQVSR